MSELPWWLEPGPDTCRFCLCAFHPEAGYHCICCDDLICPACTAEYLDSRVTVCPRCRDARKGGF